MLPHLADRPLNLQRFPNGAGAQGFWQKDIPSIVAEVAHDLARDRLPRARGPGRERPPGRGPRGDPVLAGQPGVVRDPRLDVHDRTSRGCRPSPSSTSTPARRRPGTRRSSSPASTGPPSSTSASAPTPSSPAAAASRPGSRSSAAATSTPRHAAWVEKLSRAIGATVPEPRVLGVGEGRARRQGAPRLHPERGDQDARGAVRGPPARRAPRSPRRSAGRSSTTRRSRPDRWTIRDAAGARRRGRRPVGGLQEDRQVLHHQPWPAPDARRQG